MGEKLEAETGTQEKDTKLEKDPELLNDKIEGNANGVAYVEKGMMILKVNTASPDRAKWTVHHETGHFLHRHAVGNSKEFHNDQEWKKKFGNFELNDDWKKHAGIRHRHDIAASPFVTTYGRCNMKEDIAELHALAMTKGPAYIGHCRPVIKQKWEMHRARLETLCGDTMSIKSLKTRIAHVPLTDVEMRALYPTDLCIQERFKQLQALKEYWTGKVQPSGKGRRKKSTVTGSERTIQGDGIESWEVYSL